MAKVKCSKCGGTGRVGGAVGDMSCMQCYGSGMADDYNLGQSVDTKNQSSGCLLIIGVVGSGLGALFFVADAISKIT